MKKEIVIETHRRKDKQIKCLLRAYEKQLSDGVTFKKIQNTTEYI